MFKNKKVIVVIPAYNAAKTIKRVIDDIPAFVDKTLVVDDASQDSTCQIVSKIGIECIRQPRNMGYGANQKTCYNFALSNNFDLVVMVHGDYQYDPKNIADMLKPIADGQAEITLGNRMKTAHAGNMPLYKIIGNHVHSFLMNLLLGTGIQDYATGYKAYDASALRRIAFNRFSNGFIFDEEMNVYAVRKKMRLVNVDVPTNYFEDMSSVNWLTSVIYFFQTSYVIFKSLLVRR